MDIMDMNDEMRQILRKLAELDRIHKALPEPPEWKSWERGPWELDRCWGFTWAPSSWFCEDGFVLASAAGKRYQRAAAALIEAKLIEDPTGKPKLTRARLTKRGWKLVKEMERATVKNLPISFISQTLPNSHGLKNLLVFTYEDSR